MSRFHSAFNLARTAGSRALRPSNQPGYIGWVGHANLGDEAMVEAAESLLGGKVEPMATPRIEQILGGTPLGGKRRHPHVFLGGGTLVNAGYIELVETCLAQGSRLATLGTGVGSAGFSGGEAGLDPRWVAVLNRFERVGVRGPRSLARLKAAGVEQAEVIGDLALALTPDAPLADPTAKTVLVNTCVGQSHADTERLARFDVALAEALVDLAKSGWTAIPVAFHADDLAPIAALLERAGLANEPIRQPRDFAAYSALTNGASLSISVRLHGSVLASMCGVPNLLLAYRDKCRDFAESIGAEECVVAYEAFSPTRFTAHLDAVLADRAQRSRSLHARCLDYRAKLRAYVAALP
ncbi:polysaccharide pyruvyl transferase family protein [Tsuneonella mangrovi]|uniref:polysaccharide pyruvyl transferase family protein n=1 Tax=Tsuneonella mangrovi TaxID=1982042 RepID=UPI000BA22CAD|nr:polysaccharide pyruvyl transferase family protein [Tsuneonella mangrovi]